MSVINNKTYSYKHGFIKAHTLSITWFRPFGYRRYTFTVTISLNLSLTELTLYLWTMLKGLVTVLSGAAAVERTFLVCAVLVTEVTNERAVVFTEILSIADPVILNV